MTANKTPSAAKPVGILTETYSLPALWASVLVNNDKSGTELNELTLIDEWLARTSPGNCLDADVANAGFCWHGDDSTPALGCDRCNFTFATKPAKPD